MSRRRFRVIAGEGGPGERPSRGDHDREALDGLERKVFEAQQAVARLTPRQRQVLFGILQGGSDKLIARDLGIKPRTVKAHRSGIMTRLGAAATADAVRVGIYASMDSDDE
jgi:FixJ family two-component response regulator